MVPRNATATAPASEILCSILVTVERLCADGAIMLRPACSRLLHQRRFPHSLGGFAVQAALVLVAVLLAALLLVAIEIRFSISPTDWGRSSTSSSLQIEMLMTDVTGLRNRIRGLSEHRRPDARRCEVGPNC
jgi:hypothetical protein